MSEMMGSISPRGQITIPIEIRRKLGFRSKDKVALEVSDGQLTITPLKASLDAVYQSVQALDRPLSESEMTRIAAEEHAQEVGQDGYSKRN